MSDEKKIKYSFSIDGEFFQGEFDTQEDAIANAFDMYPDYESITVGEITEASEFKSLLPKSLGDHCFDDLCDILHDEVGEASECFRLSPEERQDLGQTILNWINVHGGFKCWGVKNTKNFANPSLEKMTSTKRSSIEDDSKRDCMADFSKLMKT